MYALTPFVNAADVTKSDTTSVNCSALYVGGAGDLHIKMTTGSATVIFKAPPVGTVLNLHLKDGRVMDATTATLIVALS
jgi:hypothetical protein